MQCQKAISAPWYTRHLLLFNWRPVSSCHSAAKRPYLFTCKSSIYFFSADVTASFWLALTQCWLNVVPSSMTLFQHWTSIVSGYWVAVFPAKMRPSANAVLQLCHGRRRWASSKLALGERFILLRPIYWFANAGLMSAQCCKRWATIRLTLCHWLDFADQLWLQPQQTRGIDPMLF